MPADVVDRWLVGGRPASIQGMDLRPVEHSLLKGTSLSVQRGQAEAFNLIANVQRSVRTHSRIERLRVLLYPAALSAEAIARIRADDAGVVWLGKSSR